MALEGDKYRRAVRLTTQIMLAESALARNRLLLDSVIKTFTQNDKYEYEVFIGTRVRGERKKKRGKYGKVEESA